MNDMRTSRIIIAIVLLFSAPLLFAQERIKTTVEERTSPAFRVDEVSNKKVKRVVLVTLDTVRADHLGYMGYPRNTSPFIDTLSRKGVVFKNAFTVIPFTVSSLGSLFTSLYPLQHNVLGYASQFDEKFVTMAEYLKDSGYETAAFVGSIPVTRLFRRGFQYFDPDVADRVERRNAAKTMDSAIEWLKKKSPADCIFLWIHLFDAHTSYEKGVEFKGSAEDQLKDKESLVHYWTKNQGIELDVYRENKRESLWAAMNSYDGEIQYMDLQIRRLYEYMDESGFNKNSLWLLTSDHGEGLGSHFFYGHHKRIYNEQLRAPVVFHTPGSPGGLIINEIVSNLDMLPTLSELLEFPIESPIPISGRSLVPLISGEKATRKGFVFSMSSRSRQKGCEAARERLSRTLPISTAHWRCDDGDVKFSLQDEDNKYIRNSKGDEFYNLREDPNEKINLIGVPSEQKDVIKKVLSDMVTKMEKGQKTVKNVMTKNNIKDKLHEDSLKALGY